MVNKQVYISNSTTNDGGQGKSMYKLKFISITASTLPCAGLGNLYMYRNIINIKQIYEYCIKATEQRTREIELVTSCVRDTYGILTGFCPTSVGLAHKFFTSNGPVQRSHIIVGSYICPTFLDYTKRNTPFSYQDKRG